MIARCLTAVSAAVLSAGAAFAQPKAAPYCDDLQRVVALSKTSAGFASIAGNPREGSFQDTTVPLAGWKDCSIYGEKTYACNSDTIRSGKEARTRLVGIVRQVRACFGQGWWTEDALRTSPRYFVLHHPVGLATMTISTDEEAKNAHVIRLIMFLRH